MARDPIPPGGINQKGQMKVVDPQGIVRFIDMKQGRIMGPGGVPVKAELNIPKPGMKRGPRR